jgi:hypothetical protein
MQRPIPFNIRTQEQKLQLPPWNEPDRYRIWQVTEFPDAEGVTNSMHHLANQTRNLQS